jgi:hypothetical protein
VNQRSYLITWPGSQPDLLPVLFISHVDVVPVPEGSLKVRKAVHAVHAVWVEGQYRQYMVRYGTWYGGTGSTDTVAELAVLVVFLYEPLQIISSTAYLSCWCV